MQSEEQIRESELKKLNTIKAVLTDKSDKSIKELSDELQIPRSSIQRYLNDKEFIVNNYGMEAYLEIQEKLKSNKANGLSRGGKVTQSRFSSLRTPDGKYSGLSRK